MLGRRRTRHRADIREPVGADAGAAELRHERRKRVAHRPAGGQPEILDIGRAWVGGAHEHEQAPAAGAGLLEQRLQRVAPEQRVGGQQVGAEPGQRAERALASPEERLAVRPRRDVDVAALGVGDHEQAAVACLTDRVGERRPAGRAETLEAGDLELDRDALAGGGVEQQAAVGCDRPPRTDERLAAVPGRLARCRPQPRRVRDRCRARSAIGARRPARRGGRRLVARERPQAGAAEPMPGSRRSPRARPGWLRSSSKDA